MCKSTRRVLSIARVHGSQAHDDSNCEACRMWSMVKDRCTHLGLINSADEGISENGDGAAAPPPPPKIAGSYGV